MAVNHVGAYVSMLKQGVLCLDVNELIAVYQEMLKADKINGTDFAKEQADYITGLYPLVVLN